LFGCLNLELGSLGTGVFQKRFAVLADEGLLVVASNVVPFDTIVIEVVQNGQARFSLVVFAVIWLRTLVTSGV